jgi:hypothetical protein
MIPCPGSRSAFAGEAVMGVQSLYKLPRFKLSGAQLCVAADLLIGEH